MQETCKICGKELRSRNGGALASHITNCAKTEMFRKEFYGLKETPHLDYFREHIKETIVKTIVLEV